MLRIFTPNRVLDLFGLGKDGFKNGNKATGVQATELDAGLFNSWQEEISGVIESTGVELDPEDNTQLKTAIEYIADQRAGTPDATEAVKGKAAIATSAQALAGLNDVAFITALKLFAVLNKRTMQDVTASRALGTTYTNNTGLPLEVYVTCGVGAGQALTFRIGGVGVLPINNVGTTGTSIGVNATVPAGATYGVFGSGGSITTQHELRAS